MNDPALLRAIRVILCIALIFVQAAIYFLFGAFFVIAIALLEGTDQFVAFAVNLGQAPSLGGNLLPARLRRR